LAGRALGRHGFTAAQANATSSRLRVLGFDDARVEHRGLGGHDCVVVCCGRGGSR
jgi:hypothetical protein